MAVVEMSKLNLIAMSYDRDKILNALQRTQASALQGAKPRSKFFYRALKLIIRQIKSSLTTSAK